MAVKNMQTLETLAADLQGVRVTGTECKGSMRIGGTFPAPISSVFRLPLPGPYPFMPAADADNTATVQAVKRTGRSASKAGHLARSVSWFVPSTRSAFSQRS